MASTTSTAPQLAKRRQPPECATNGRRTRTNKACLHCQSRKIRCDVMGEGMPCTNCKLYKKECVLREGKRERARQQRNHKVLGPRYRMSREMNNEMLANQNPVNLSTVLDPVNYEDAGPSGSALFTPQDESQACPNGVDPRANLPNYISLPPQMSSTDLDYLWREGALVIPEDELRDALLHCFALFVYPLMPVIDLGEFFASVENNSETNTVSLMLFQAVMAAAIAYVDASLLEKLGYNSMREAREKFFNRANLLYSLQCEADKVTVLQTVILMTFWTGSSKSLSDTRYFIDIATYLAQVIGREPTTGVSQRLWKRILWTCYVKDRITAIGFQGPMTIRDEAFQVPRLELEDFDIQSWTEHVCQVSPHNGGPNWSPSICTLAKISVALAECCRHISHILERQSVAHNNVPDREQGRAIHIVGRTPNLIYCSASQCDKDLDTWHQTFPRDLQWARKPLPREMNSSYNNAVIVHRAVLNGVYLAARSASCRTHLAHIKESPQIKFHFERRIHQASMDIIDMFHHLDASGLMSCMSDIGVPILQSTIATCLLGVKSLDLQTRQISNTRFKFCLKLLQQMRDVYSSADTVSFSAVAAARSFGLSTALGPTASTGRNANASGSMPAVMNISHTAAEAAIPKFLSPTPQVTHRPKCQATCNPMAFILSLTMTPQEREFLTQLSSPPGSTDSTVDRNSSTSSPKKEKAEERLTCHHRQSECSDIEDTVGKDN